MKHLPSFAAGMLTMALVGSVSVGALAATGQLTITVDPVNIQVNGETFQPKDAKGNDVPVFAYNGTTYAPLRALAEAYGLEVGYDAQAKMATVGAAPDTTATPADYSDWSAEEEAAYQEIVGMWEVRYKGLEKSPGSDSLVPGDRDFYVAYPATTDNNAMQNWGNLPQNAREKYVYRWMSELQGDVGVILSLCKEDGASASYAYSIFENGYFWPGHD